MIDNKNKTEEEFTLEGEVQDMVSTLYYLRNQDISNLKVGDEITLAMFFDQTNYQFKLRLLGREDSPLFLYQRHLLILNGRV